MTQPMLCARLPPRCAQTGFLLPQLAVTAIVESLPVA